MVSLMIEKNEDKTRYSKKKSTFHQLIQIELISLKICSCGSLIIFLCSVGARVMTHHFGRGKNRCENIISIGLHERIGAWIPSLLDLRMFEADTMKILWIQKPFCVSANGSSHRLGHFIFCHGRWFINFLFVFHCRHLIYIPPLFIFAVFRHFYRVNAIFNICSREWQAASFW